MLAALQIWAVSTADAQEHAAIPLEMVGGVAGAAATSIVFATIGAGMARGGGEDPGLVEFVIGGFIGTLIGSSAGVAAVGRITRDEGSFGAALLGSACGLGVFLLMTPSLDADYAPFYMALWGLPAAGAALAFHLSGRERYRSQGVRAGPISMSIVPQLNGPTALRLSVSF